MCFKEVPMWMRVWLVLLAAACGAGGCAWGRPIMAVALSVTDLRKEPNTASAAGTHDPLEETQLLYGEKVRVRKLQKDWAYVEAIEQPEFTHAKRWQGYPGWVPVASLFPLGAGWDPNIVVTEKWALTWQDAGASVPARWKFPMGTRLRALDMHGNMWRLKLLDGDTVWMPSHYAKSLAEVHRSTPEDQRWAIVTNAQQLVGDAYLWGGRSPRLKTVVDPVTGVDCSGLVNLAYRAAGVTIPRDAHEQFLRARRVTTLHPGDLIFLSDRGHPKQIVHVMLYAGEGDVIEGPGTGSTVRRISLVDRLGRSLEDLHNSTVVDGQTVYFGSYLGDGSRSPLWWWGWWS